MGAGEGIRAAAMAALAGVEGLGVHDSGSVQAAWPYAEVDAGLESDWGFKEGEGREVRLAVAVRDKGERPGRAQVMLGAVEQAIGGIAADAVDGWRIVSLRYLRTRLVRTKAGEWAGVAEFRARMLRSV